METKEEKEQLLIEGRTQMVLFRGEEIRKVFHEGEWHFSIVDVIGALMGPKRPSKHWVDLKKKLIEEEGFSELSEKIGQLKMPGSDGKMYSTDATDTETLFRIVQSIPSKKAEPFKRWLAKVGYERIKETENPEIAIKRAMLTYKIKGYSDEWINTRLQALSSRKELTKEWNNRGVKPGWQYAALTDAISLGTFGMRTKEHKEYKGLPETGELRDHMMPLELALTTLGETATTEIAKSQDSQGYTQNHRAAKIGGEVAGKAREDIEERLSRRVLSKENYLPKKKTPKKLLHSDHGQET